jgi:hypothetical protein
VIVSYYFSTSKENQPFIFVAIQQFTRIYVEQFTQAGGAYDSVIGGEGI